MRPTLTHLAVILALMALLGCKSTVTVQGDPGDAGSTAASGGECVPCTTLGISSHYDHGLPFCAGEQEKYDALLACACQPSTCAPPDDANVCSAPETTYPLYLCEGAPLGGACEKCLRNKCPEAWRECCPGGEPCDF
jgi:hypothetical protein